MSLLVVLPSCGHCWSHRCVAISGAGAALTSPLRHRPWCCPCVAVAGATIASLSVVLVLPSCRPCVTARGAALTCICWCHGCVAPSVVLLSCEGPLRDTVTIYSCKSAQHQPC